MTFRYDINGLRALAIIGVVLYHFKPEIMPGGFAGVDVFFVISGYLMTKIIYEGVREQSFNLVSFYTARANRIIPALATLCLCLLIFGWLFINPADYYIMSKHIASAVTFISNFIFWHESGYFDSESTEKWLLHTWSLSLEWQFYIIFPFILLTLNKFFSKEKLKISLVFLSLISLSFCISIRKSYPDFSFFILPARCWELMIGGVVYFYPVKLSKHNGRILEIIGLLLILFSYAFLNSSMRWPGYLAIIPVLGASLVLLANNQNSKLTNNVSFQLIGKYSYSIYLWHWPIVVAFNYYSTTIGWWWGVMLALTLGALSYHFIEKPKLNISAKYSFKYRAYHYSILLTLLSIGVYYSKGAVFRFPELNGSLIESAINIDEDWSYPKESNLKINGLNIRYIEGKTKENILFIGASHMEQTYPYAQKFGDKYNIYYLTKGGCFVTPSMKHKKNSCRNIQDYNKLFSEFKFKKIVTTFYTFTSNLSQINNIRYQQIEKRIEEYDAFLKDLKSRADEVYLIREEPIGLEFDPKSSIRYRLNNFTFESEVRAKYQTHENAFNRLTELDGINIIEPIKHLCKNGKCYTRNDERFFYRDSGHMTASYTLEACDYLRPIFD